jgi:hypothetical protein
LKDSSHTDKNSTITFRDNNGRAASATITVDLSPRNSEPSGVTTIWNGAMQLNWDWALNYLSVNRQIATGSRVTLNFTTTNGGSFKLHDVNGGANVIVLPNVSYGNNPGIISVNAGVTSYSFDVTNSIQVNNQNINGILNGLKINGEGVMMTSIVLTNTAASTESVIDCNFNNGLDNFYKNGDGGEVSNENSTLRLKNDTRRENPWNAQAMLETSQIVYGATYTLTFKAKITEGTTGSFGVAIQRTQGGNQYTYYYVIKDISEIFNNVQKDQEGWANIVFDNAINIKNNEDSNNPTHFMFNFGHLVGTIYIDDLKLVRTN